MNATATQRQVLILEIERLENKIRKNGSDIATVEELEKACQQLKALEFPNPRRIVNDTTVEKLGEMMSDNSNGLTCVRDELSGLLSSYDKQGGKETAPFTSRRGTAKTPSPVIVFQENQFTLRR
jgi:putative DNA primase/helicase